MVRIYAFSGKAGAGKDYIARKFIGANMNPNYAYLCFSDPMKARAYAEDKVEFDQLFDNKTAWSRQLLQTRGTLARTSFGSDIWINYMEFHIKAAVSRGINTIIITDVRYKNEYEWLLSMNATIFRVKANDRTQDRYWREGLTALNVQTIANHTSETDLDDVVFSKVIDNSYSASSIKQNLQLVLPGTCAYVSVMLTLIAFAFILTILLRP